VHFVILLINEYWIGLDGKCSGIAAICVHVAVNKSPTTIHHAN